jgi:hypothetical protein
MDRPAVVEVLDIDELMAVKAKSPGAARSDSPWNDPAIGFPAMCQKTAKRRLARSMPLNVMQQAARMDEAVDEQGAPAWISPDKGVVIDGEFSDAPTINHEQRGTDELLTPKNGADDLMAWDSKLATAAHMGIEALRETWGHVPKQLKPMLKAAMDNRHKPSAEAVAVV